MTEPVPPRCTVAMLGFSTFEHGALSSFFRLAEARTPAYIESGDVGSADFLVANADDADSIAAVRERKRLSDTVFIGQTTPAGAVACLRRPIEPTHIVRELDALLGQRVAHLGRPVDRDAVSERPGHPKDGAPPKDVLVVDDSRVARRFLEVRLQRHGYCVHTAATPEQALERLAAQPFAMVFLDVALGPRASMDGLALCQHIKQGTTHSGEPAPQVALVTSLSSSSDRVRGALAGCDAYLTKPVMENDLAQALRTLDPSLAA